jgi:hypothetical protein
MHKCRGLTKSDDFWGLNNENSVLMDISSSDVNKDLNAKAKAWTLKAKAWALKAKAKAKA